MIYHNKEMNLVIIKQMFKQNRLKVNTIRIKKIKNKMSNGSNYREEILLKARRGKLKLLLQVRRKLNLICFLEIIIIMIMKLVTIKKLFSHILETKLS